MASRCGAGWLKVIVGPMFAGKTTALIAEWDRGNMRRWKIGCFKPDTDTRGRGTKVVESHGGLRIACTPLPWRGVVQPYGTQHLDLVIIDEVQFFENPADITHWIGLWISSCHARVIVAGLLRDWQGKPFESTLAVMSMADEVISMCAVCGICGVDAAWTGRNDDTSEAVKRIQVGGAETYRALCRTCWTQCQGAPTRT